MDNTELHYLTYDPDEIWDQMITNYVDAGGDIIYPGDEKDMLLRSVQADIMQVFAGVDNALRMHTLRYAQGEYLDAYGENRGCVRIQASAATASVTITTNATGRSDILEAGTAMSADGIQFYVLIEDLRLSGYAQTITATIEASQVGSAGNGLVRGKQMTLAVINPGINSIVVAEDAAGGNREEDDETYRERIRTYNLTGTTTGPHTQYEAASKGVSSEIIDAKALNLGGGKVGIYLIFSGSDGKTAIMQSVQDALSAQDVRPLTDEISVHEAENVPYTLNVEYSSDGSNAVSTAISEALSEYQEWQDNRIGRAFNPDRLLASIYHAGATRVKWGDGSSFNSTAKVEYTEIKDTQRCKGTITLKAITE